MIKLFDLGMGSGSDTEFFVKFFEQNSLPYKVYGFEPAPDTYATLVEKFKSNKNITVMNFAVSDTEKKCNLYDATRPSSRSLHSEKFNVYKNKFMEVNAIKFSDFFEKNYDPINDFCIIHCNIEGSEYELYTDLIESKMSKEIKLYFGSLGDLYKVGKSKEEIENFLSYLKTNNIEVVTANDQSVKAILEKMGDKTIEKVIEPVKEEEPTWFVPIETPEVEEPIVTKVEEPKTTKKTRAKRKSRKEK